MRSNQNNNYCLDSYDGGAGRTLFLRTCDNDTERFRAGDYELGIMDRKSNGTGCNLYGSTDCGHTFLYAAKYNQYNNVERLTTFSKWSNVDNTVNNPSNYKGQHDQSQFTGNNIHVNNTLDLPDAYSLSQLNNYNTSNGNYTYWQKNISYDQWYDAVTGGFKSGRSTGYNVFLLDYCTTYAKDVWYKYDGNWLGLNLTPDGIYSVLQSTQLYD